MDEQQYDLELTERVKAYAKEIGSALVGIADAGILNEALEPDFRRRTACQDAAVSSCCPCTSPTERWKSCAAGR